MTEKGTAKRYSQELDYMREQLTNSHALLGRVVHQMSERQDTANLTKWFPTGKRPVEDGRSQRRR